MFQDISNSLPQSGISAIFGGTTAVVALVREHKLWVANAGDSRAMVAGRDDSGAVVAHALTWDQVTLQSRRGAAFVSYCCSTNEFMSGKVQPEGLGPLTCQIAALY